MHLNFEDKYRKKNKINRNPRGLILTLIYKIFTYFSSYENSYFLILSVVQFLTWSKLGVLPSNLSPTGPFSTFVPLIFCLSLELVMVSISWITTLIEDRFENNRIFEVYISSDVGTRHIKNSQICSGFILKVNKNTICPVDGILLETNDKTAKISCSLITGETNPKYVEKISNIKDCLNSLFDYQNRIVVINNNSTTIQITDKNMIYSGSLILAEYVYILVTHCGTDIKYFNQPKCRVSFSSIDQFVKEIMLKVNLILLLIGIIILTIIKSYLTDNTLAFIATQSWILLNGIIPFSIKIFLIISRSIQKYWYSTSLIKIHTSTIVDDLHKIKHIITDKTGTLTKNTLSIAGFLEPNNNFQSIPSIDFAKFIALSVNFENGKPVTPEDEVLCPNLQLIESVQTSFKILTPEQSLIVYKNGIIYIEDSYKEIVIEDFKFTSERKRSSKLLLYENSSNISKLILISKGSIASIKSCLIKRDAIELDNLCQILNTKYSECRVLVFAMRQIGRSEFINPEILEKNLSLLGIVAITDPLQDEVETTISNLKLRNISISMCTGDRKETAMAIAQKIGLLTDKTYVCKGSELMAFNSNIPSNFIVYECTPENKRECAIVLGSDKVCCIGDGYNDLAMFSASAVAISIRGCLNVEHSSDFTIQQFKDTSRVFSISDHLLNISTRLIHFTFFRTALISCCLFIHSILNPNSSSIFNGFVLQGFNSIWILGSVVMLIVHKNNLNCKNLSFTINWILYGILTAPTILAILLVYMHEENISDILAFITIFICNYICMEGTRYKNFIGCVCGLISYFVYENYINDGGVSLFQELLSMNVIVWPILGVMVISWKKFCNC